MSLEFLQVNEKQRLKIKNEADETRYRWAKRGITDIFDILENTCILIRRPIEPVRFSGFSTYFENNYVIFLNSSFTLGHERFTGAHELCHITYHLETLKQNGMLMNSQKNPLDEVADIFAAELLMPEDGIKEIFYKLIDTNPEEVNVRHIIQMHNYFKVSYKAMLKRLVYFRLCSSILYEELLKIALPGREEEFQILTTNEGFTIDLITSSKVQSISREYIENVRDNYVKNNISFGKLTELLNFIGKTPEEYGHIRDED